MSTTMPIRQGRGAARAALVGAALGCLLAGCAPMGAVPGSLTGRPGSKAQPAEDGSRHFALPLAWARHTTTIPGLTGPGWHTAFGGDDSSKVLLRRVLILNLSQHPLAARTALSLQEALLERTSVERVDYLPRGHALESGTPAPDLVITLQLAEATRRWLPFWRKETAWVLVKTSLTPTDGDTVVDRAPRLPTVQLSYQAPIRHESRLVGIALPHWKAAGDELARKIAGDLEELLESALKEHRTMPEPPAFAHGSFREGEPLPFLDRYPSTPVYHCTAPLRHNVSAWILEAAPAKKDLWAELLAELGEAGWESLPSVCGSVVNLSKGTKRLMVLPFPSGSQLTVWSRSEPPLHRSKEEVIEAEAGPAAYAVLYQEHVDPDEAWATLDRLGIAAEEPPEGRR